VAFLLGAGATEEFFSSPRTMPATETGWHWGSSAGIGDRRQQLSSSGVPFFQLQGALIKKGPINTPPRSNTNAWLLESAGRSQGPLVCNASLSLGLPAADAADEVRNLAPANKDSAHSAVGADAWEDLDDSACKSPGLPLVKLPLRWWVDAEESDDSNSRCPTNVENDVQLTSKLVACDADHHDVSEEDEKSKVVWPEVIHHQFPAGWRSTLSAFRGFLAS